MNDNALTIVANPHPFDSRQTVYAEVQAGQTIAEMLGEGVSQTCVVSVGGYPVPRELWTRVRPKAGQIITAAMLPQGGGGGKVLRMVAMAALVYFTAGAGAFSLAGVTGLSGGALAAAQVGAMMIGSLAINALIPPPTPKLGAGGGDPFQQLQSITGTSNNANPYGVIPCVVGQTRFFPPHAALPYTEISGQDQYLRMLLDLGYGDLDVSDIRIGETDIASYDDVEWEIGTAPSLFTQDVYELTVGTALVKTNDTATRTTQGATTEISLDIVFGNGLFAINKKGDNINATVAFAVQYRPTGSAIWTDIAAATGLTFSGGLSIINGSNIHVTSAAKRTLRCGIRWTVPTGQYDVIVTRIGDDFSGEAQAGSHSADASWTVLRSISPQLPSTTGTNKLAVRIKATDQLNGVVQNLSVQASQRVRRWDAVNNAWLAPVSSTNPAWIYLWLCTQCEAVQRRLADARMDLYGIAEWAAECDAKGLAIGFVMDSGRAFSDWLRDVLAAGRASFGLRNGQYSAVRDVLQTVPVQLFTPANSADFSFARVFTAPPHALRVKFTNPEANYQNDVRTVYADGYTEANATKFEELDLSMVVDPDAAWRLGRYHLAVGWNRPNTYSFTADIEHLVCERGDLIHVAHDIIGYGLAWGRITALTATTVTLDGPVTLEAGKTYQIQARAQDGAQYTAGVSAPAGQPTQQLTLAAALSGAQVGDLFVLGEVNKVVTPLVVKWIEPNDDLSAKITAVDAAPIVLTADAGTPPPFVSDITGQVWCAPPDPPVVHIVASDSAPNDGGVIDAQASVGNSTPKGGIYRLPIADRRFPLRETSSQSMVIA